MKYQYIDDAEKIEILKKEVEGIPPEDINNGDETVPSKRLLHHFQYKKGDRVMNVLKRIGIERMLCECPHFSEWIEAIKNLTI